MRPACLFLCVLLLLAPSANAAPPVNAAQKRLASLLKAADEDDLRLNPQAGLQRGDMRRAGDYGDGISDAYFAKSKALLARQLAALERIDRSKLDPNERIAYDTFSYSARFALGQHRDGTLRIARELLIEPVWGQQLQFLQLSSGKGRRRTRRWRTTTPGSSASTASWSSSIVRSAA